MATTVLPSVHPECLGIHFPTLNTWKASPNLQHTPWPCRNLETHTTLNQAGPLPSALGMHPKSRWIKCKSSLQRFITNRPRLNGYSVWVGWGPVVPLLLSWIRSGLASPSQPQIGILACGWERDPHPSSLQTYSNVKELSVRRIFRTWTQWGGRGLMQGKCAHSIVNKHSQQKPGHRWG